MKVKQHWLFMATLIIFTLTTLGSFLTAAPGEQKACAKKKAGATEKACAKEKKFDLEAVKEKLSKNPGLLNKVFENGNTHLHNAVMKINPELAGFLLEKGLDVNLPNKWGYTPLHYSVLRPNPVSVKLLLKNGANVDAKNEDGDTPLALAVKQGDVKGTAILLTAGADPAFVFQTNQRTLAHVSALKGTDAIMAKLLEKSAPVDTKDNDGFTPVDYAFKYGHVKVAKMLIKNGLKPAEGITKNFQPTPLLKKNLPEKTAAVWYLGHSGWAVKTTDKLLVFDYFRRTEDPFSPLLANGRLSTEELKDLDVYFFVSHGHLDHYDAIIHKMKDNLKSATYVMGFEPKETTDYIHMAANTKKKIGNMKVLTFKAEDDGVGFLVLTNGMSILHAGDHYNKSEDFSGPFIQDMKKIAEITKIDMAFIPIGGGCRFGNKELVEKGVIKAVKILNPTTFFPMHQLGEEENYQKMAETLKKASIPTITACAKNRGDHFVYHNGNVKQI